MKEKLKNASGLQLFLYSAAAIIIIFFLRGIADFASESLARFTGHMQTATYSVQDFEQVAIAQKDKDTFVATDGDPQLIMNFAPEDIKVSRISFECEFSMRPGEILMYYTTKEGRGFSAAKRYWFSENEPAVYTTSFRMKNIKSIRIDPTTQAGNTMKIKTITFNPPKSFLSFFQIGFGEIFNLVIYSAILASVAALAKEMLFSGIGTKIKKDKN